MLLVTRVPPRAPCFYSRRVTASSVSFLEDTKAVLFDLDGVLTPTADLHRDAWANLFTEYFARAGVAPYTEDDYFQHLDGRPRYDAVAALVAARGIDIPFGQPSDGPDVETACGLGNRKNMLFNEMLKSAGITPYPGSVAFLDHLNDLGNVEVAVVSSSKNAVDVLEAAGLKDRFEVIVDGKVAAARNIEGKPAPDTYLEAASLLGLNPEQCVVVEDAVSGVEAGRGGGFAHVIGVDRGVGKEALLENGATIVVEDLGDLLPAEAASDWTLHSGHLDVHDPNVLSTIFSLSNGYLGTRGNHGLWVAGGSHQDSPKTAAAAAATRGTYLNGYHEVWTIVHAEDAHGFARLGQSILTLPDATGLHLLIDGVPVSEAGSLSGHLTDDGWHLDMAKGALTRRFLWTAADGNRVNINQVSAVSLFDPHLLVISLEVSPLDGPVEVEVISTVLSPLGEMPVATIEPGEHEMGDPRNATSLADGSLREAERETSQAKGTFLYRADGSEMEAALALSNSAELVGEGTAVPTPVPLVEVDTQVGESARWEATQTVPQGETFTFTKTLSYVRGDLFEDDGGDLTSTALASLTQATSAGLLAFFARQRRFLQDQWDVSDVMVGGADNASLRVRVRFGLFTLLQATARLKRTGVPAKGLSGAGYDGHYFWDSEVYMLPFLNHTFPSAAKEMLGYRYLTLDTARTRAKEMAEEGALFPWRSITGPESSAYYPAGTAQYHINADIAYALCQYAEASGDEQFMVDAGIDILVETARLWSSLGFFGADEKFHIHGVTGPDEYTAVVNDNLYTNAMARENLLAANKWVEWLKRTRPTSYQEMQARLDFTEEEAAQFKRAGLNMHIPWDENLGVNPQDDSFLTKEKWDFAGTPPEKYPLLLHYHPLVIYRHQVIKQADTILAMYMLGPRFTAEQKKANFAFYDPLTTGDSSLSAVAQGIVAAEVGRADLAGAYFQQVLDADLKNLHGNTGVGLHVASAGGVWSSLIMGFVGLRDLGGVLRFDPHLPEDWENIEFTLVRRGNPLRIEVTHEAMFFDFEGDEGESETVFVAGKPHRVTVGETLEVALNA